MKRFFSIATGALALGLAAITPSFAKADNRHDDRHDVRVEHREVDRHVEVRHDSHDGGAWDHRPVYVDRRPVVVDRRPVIVDQRPVYVNNDCDLSVSLYDVPAAVMDTVRCEAPGQVESARLIRDNGLEFYRVEVNVGRGDRFVRVACDGHLLGVDVG
jgi:hypothetical protein